MNGLEIANPMFEIFDFEFMALPGIGSKFALSLRDDRFELASGEAYINERSNLIELKMCSDNAEIVIRFRFSERRPLPKFLKHSSLIVINHSAYSDSVSYPVRFKAEVS